MNLHEGTVFTDPENWQQDLRTAIRRMASRSSGLRLSTAGNLMGETGCEAQGRDHRWIIDHCDGVDFWRCLDCGDVEKPSTSEMDGGGWRAQGR